MAASKLKRPDPALRAKLEVLFVLRSLQRRQTLLRVFFRDGREAIISSVLHVEAEAGRFLFALGRNPDANSRLPASHEVQFVTGEGDDASRFTCTQVEPTTWEGLTVFAAAIPERIEHHFMRENARIELPEDHPTRVIVPVHGTQASTVTCRVFDISRGGISLFFPDAKQPVKVGSQFYKCQMQLPEHGNVEVDLEVRHVARENSISGVPGLRLGTVFLDLPAYAANRIEKFIHDLRKNSGLKQLESKAE